MSLGARYWQRRFNRWTPPGETTDGYTLLMPVPGDLPVFAEIALTVCALQTHQHRAATILLPDRPTLAVRNVFAHAARNWPGELILAKLPVPERYLLPRLNNPSRNHAIQLIEGIERTRSSHVVLHDADLFLLEHDVLDRHYLASVAGGYAVHGVDPVWDPWFAEHGLHLAATWEMCAETAWLRSWPAHLHMGHTASMFGQDHVFDTILHAQALTPPERLHVTEMPDEIVHFNYVISTYRKFQNSSGRFGDDAFRLLLIRLFIDLFATEPFDYRLPDAGQLARGLSDPGAPVGYPDPDVAGPDYHAYRAKVERILSGPWAGQGRREQVATALAAFDAHYGYRS